MPVSCSWPLTGPPKLNIAIRHGQLFRIRPHDPIDPRVSVFVDAVFRALIGPRLARRVKRLRGVLDGYCEVGQRALLVDGIGLGPEIDPVVIDPLFFRFAARDSATSASLIAVAATDRQNEARSWRITTSDSPGIRNAIDSG